MNEALNIVKSSSTEYVIVMVGDTSETIGENTDRVDLELSGGQLQLINNIITIKPNNTIVILLNGRPTTFGTGLFNQYGTYANGNNLIDSIHTLLSAYHPGEQGGNALLDIIFGNFNPSGKLSSSWPQSSSHVHSNMHSPSLKLFQGHENFNYVYNTISPLFPFGYSYQNGYINDNDITHSKLISLVPIVENCKWKISLNVTNNSSIYDTYHIIQIYFMKWVSDVVRYELNLGGFAKVFLPKNSQQMVDVYITADSLAYYDAYNDRWVLESGLYYFYDGKDTWNYDYYSTLLFTLEQTFYNPCKFWDVLNIN